MDKDKTSARAILEIQRDRFERLIDGPTGGLVERTIWLAALNKIDRELADMETPNA